MKRIVDNIIGGIGCLAFIMFFIGFIVELWVGNNIGFKIVLTSVLVFTPSAIYIKAMCPTNEEEVNDGIEE